jgi:erythromycin esterase
MSGDPVSTERLSEYATPLETTDPTADLDDLRPLTDRFEDATVVALGEATHGTREFFRLKHRLIRLLVEELGYRAVGLEASFAETLAINDYVVRGEGDLREALAGIYFWTWDTEEVLALIEWLREFNAERPLDDRVRFYGFDMQHTQQAGAAVSEFLATVDPDFLREVSHGLGRIERMVFKDAESADDRCLIEAERDAAALADRLDEHEREYAARTSEREWRLARQHCRVLEQAVDQTVEQVTEGYIAAARLRDRYMAETVEWLLDYGDADRIALWGHNAHVARTGDDEGDRRPLGSHLAGTFGDRYVAVGCEFCRGSFRARPWESEGDRSVEEFTVEPLPERGPDLVDAAEERDPSSEDLPEPLLTAALSDLATDRACVDLGAADADPELSGWLDRPHLMHAIGALFSEGEREHHAYGAVRPTEQFDGLLYVEASTPSVPVDD